MREPSVNGLPNSDAGPPGLARAYYGADRIVDYPVELIAVSGKSADLADWSSDDPSRCRLPGGHDCRLFPNFGRGPTNCRLWQDFR